MSPGPRPTSVPNGIFIHPSAVWSKQTWAGNWGLCHFGGAGSPCNTMSPGPMSTSLSSGIHPAVWPQQTQAENGGWGWCAPFKGELSPHVTQCGLGRGLPHSQYQVAPSSMQQFGHNVGQNWGCCAPSPFGGERGSHLTQCRLDRGLPAYQVA